jgi:hypothetical protein
LGEDFSCSCLWRLIVLRDDLFLFVFLRAENVSFDLGIAQRYQT